MNTLNNGEPATGAPNSFVRAMQEPTYNDFLYLVGAALNCVCGPRGTYQTMFIGNVRFDREDDGTIGYDIPVSQWDQSSLNQAFADIQRDYPRFIHEWYEERRLAELNVTKTSTVGDTL